MPRLDKETILRDVDKQVNNLPAFSPVVTKVLKIIDNPVSSASDIERVIKYDQALAARALRMANSAYYGYGGKISTISQSVVILGLNTLRAILFTASASKMINKKLIGYKLDEGKLWEHSVLTALGAKTLAGKIKYQNVEEAFISGLLHDIGKLVLDRYVAQNYEAIIEHISSKKISFSEAEREILGIDHAQVGSKLSEKWNLPPALTESIAFHHQPEASPSNKILPAIISVSTKIATSFSSRLSDKIISLDINLKETTLDILDISPQIARDLIPVIQSAYKDVNSFLRI